jgi:protein-S-isoprenylcysteine O-methyltransferase Ste14
MLFVACVIPIQIISFNIPVWLCYSGLVLVVFGIVLGVVAMLQINTKLSPFPTPVSDSKLLTTVAFAKARHPIYTAILLATFGYSLFQISIYKFVIFIALLVLFYLKSTYEERLLSDRFSEYLQYKNKTRRFL